MDLSLSMIANRKQDGEQDEHGHGGEPGLGGLRRQACARLAGQGTGEHGGESFEGSAEAQEDIDDMNRLRKQLGRGKPPARTPNAGINNDLAGVAGGGRGAGAGASSAGYDDDALGELIDAKRKRKANAGGGSRKIGEAERQHAAQYDRARENLGAMKELGFLATKKKARQSSEHARAANRAAGPRHSGPSSSGPPMKRAKNIRDIVVDPQMFSIDKVLMLLNIKKLKSLNSEFEKIVKEDRMKEALKQKRKDKQNEKILQEQQKKQTEQ